MVTAEFKQRLMDLQANMLNFAYMLTSNRDDAHDLLQDTTLKALDNADKYVDNANFKGWVFTIMRNLFINRYRRSAYEATLVDTSDQRLNVAVESSSAASPEGTFSVVEITNAINEFPEKFRVPFSMHIAGYKYHEIADHTGLPIGTVKYHEIADHTGLPIGTVKSRIFTARTQLQLRFADYR